ncbi:MAG TPA: XdhC family protein [Geminicoccus sp.]|uniref:XdhC family protein n=1 Tax=Geminicoccus sp. TaxID=2024832 RepID=UPI002C654A7B|nr:XdhC family protein [Geminicoccus sp.]HWL68372.1 XdhC family protein [Geminicoccus sp.]
MKLALLDALEAARKAKRQVCLVRLLDQGGTEALVVDGRQTEGAPLPEDALEAARAALREDRSKTAETSAGKAFLQVFNPPLRMIIVGAVHITQSLAPMAELAGYEVTVVDPRRAFATDQRFPNTRVTQDWPDEALEQLAPDRRTAVIALVHDPKLDDPALDVALKSDAFYIAALGSKKNAAARQERLQALGHDPATTARIRGPAGLPIGAVSPAEIAISVLAECTQALRQGS